MLMGGEDVNIEDIEYTNDSTRVVIKEDESKDKDYKGRVVDKFVEIWQDKYYGYVFKQELILSEEYFQWLDINPDNYKDYLIPDKLYIEGQRYKKFPNQKIKLKLK